MCTQTCLVMCIWIPQVSLTSSQVLPHLSLSSIADYLELNQLGRAEGETFFLHSCSQQVE